MRLAIILGLAAAVSAWGDSECDNIGGTCWDYRYNVCPAGYETGLCSGDSNRKCCNNCNWTCQNNENYYSSSGQDDACISDGGQCMHNSNYCAGSYESMKCGGPTERQCCISNSAGGGAGDGYGCYGNIDNVDTTGASSATASQDSLSYSGVQASRTMAQNDAANMEQYRSFIEQAASELCMDASVIAGIISRETRAGAVLGSDGYGYDGHGYGLMQVDDRYHTLQGGPYSIAHIKQGTPAPACSTGCNYDLNCVMSKWLSEILAGMINGVQSKHPSWTQDMAYKGGISAYNAGVGNVDSYENMDVGTTGNDYANDVVARSQYYKDNGY